MEAFFYMGPDFDEEYEPFRISDRRPQFQKESIVHRPDQITDPGQLTAGGVYLFIHNRAGAEIHQYDFEFISFEGEGKIRIRVLPGGREESVSLADRGVIPYENGVWNPVNYIVPADEYYSEIKNLIEDINEIGRNWEL